MKLTDIAKAILLEKKGDSYEKGCVMLYFSFPQLKEIQSKIDKEDLYTEEGDRTYGLEDEPHTTLLFGIDPKVPLEDIVEIIDDFTYSPCIIKDVSLFKNEKYDVLKFDVEGDNLHETNQALTDEIPYENDYPEYHPHLTIGYVKVGKGDKYVKIFEGKEYSLIPKYAVFSSPNGQKYKIPIKVNKK